jgi:hypothetical protein
MTDKLHARLDRYDSGRDNPGHQRKGVDSRGNGKAVIVVDKAKAEMVIADPNAIATIAVMVFRAVGAKLQKGLVVDGTTINNGGSTSWAVRQPPRRVYYGRASALWPWRLHPLCLLVPAMCHASESS